MSESYTPVLLSQARIINWHSITERTFDFPRSGALVFGTNGSGKTTLLDALQFALFPNLRDLRFNSAVATSAIDRDISGYVRQKINETEYRWPVRISYIALRLTRGDETTTFLVGVHADATGIVERIHASVSGITDVRALRLVTEDDDVVPISTVDTAVRSMGGHVYKTIESYEGDIALFFGGLTSQWKGRLISSIGFKEISDATKFVRRFLAERPVDHKSLLETFESYHALETKARQVAGWAEMLRKALDEFRPGLRIEEQSSLVLYRHFRSLALRYQIAQYVLPVQLAEGEATLTRQAISRAEEAAEDLRRQGEAVGHEIEDEETRLMGIRAEMDGRGIARQIEDLQRDIQEGKKSVADAEDALEQVTAYRGKIAALVPHLTRGTLALLQNGPAPILGFAEILKESGLRRVSELVEDAAGIDLRRANGFRTLATEAEQVFGRALFAAEGEVGRLQREIQEMEDDVAALRRGRPRYWPEVEATRRMLQDKLGWVDARPLCEMIEVPEQHEEWRKAVEAELGNARFYFVVPPALHDDARRLYMQYRDRGYPMPSGERVPLYRASIVDVGKIRSERVNVAEADSLARKVKPDNPDVGDYVAYSLGRVTCERDFSRLVSHRHAIMPNLAFYRGYRTSSHDPNSLTLYVGSYARLARLASLEAELPLRRARLEDLRRAKDALFQVHSILRTSLNEFEPFASAVSESRELDARKTRLARLEESLERLRTDTDHQAIIERFEATQKTITDLKGRLEELIRQRERAKLQAEDLEKQAKAKEDSIPGFLSEQEEGLLKIPPVERREALVAFKVFWEDEFGREADLGTRVAKIREFHRTAPRNERDNETRANEGRRGFTTAVGAYRQAAGFTTEATVEDPEPLIAEYRRIIDTALPAQEEALREKALKMRQVMVEKVLHSLGAQFQAVNRLLEDINRSTEKVRTKLGYFKLVPKPTEELGSIHLLAQSSLGVRDFEALRQADPDDPFVIGVESFMDRLLRDAKHRDALCDYRNYLDFQVHQRPEDRRDFRPFRGTIGGGSGGERQVPYYIMTFALMDHVYRQGANKKYRGRLLLMDEVFHNMSDDNVRDVMRLGLDLGLQIIMVTPGKIRTLAPMLGKTIQAAKDIAEPEYPTRFIEYERDNLPEDMLDFEEYPAAAGHALA
jgi:energy-coupling factor transporter ATP-binding protein EcfA2